MNKHNQRNYFDIILVGYGPVSKLAALLFSRLGWRVAVFERRGEVYPLPRAVCIDHEVFRMLHAAGLGPIVDKVTEAAPMYRWYNADWQELLSINWPGGSISGGSEVNFVHQPSLEHELDAEVKRKNNISLFFEHDCVGISQSSEQVDIEVENNLTGKRAQYSSKYAIGIDGANSFVRKSLEVSQTDLGFEADWLVVDYELKDNLTAKDLGLIECGQYCNPTRPTTIVPGGRVNGKEYRRWEFMRLPHETREEMVQPEKLEELLGDWIKPEQGDLVRHALYTFRSLITNKWRHQRIFLAGDAAHLMPPFMGQGMCAGFRDVWNLSWKLDRVLRGEAADSLLDSYEVERKPHVTRAIELSMFLGSIICMPDPEDAKKRDAEFLSDQPPKMEALPGFTNGLLAKKQNGDLFPCAGDLSPHGTVRYQRRTTRLDYFIDSDEYLLILNAQLPLSSISNKAHEQLKAMNISVVEVHDRHAAQDHHYADTQGQLLPFMQQNGVNALLVRPDHYVYGGAKNQEELAGLLSALEGEPSIHCHLSAAS